MSLAGDSIIRVDAARRELVFLGELHGLLSSGRVKRAVELLAQRLEVLEGFVGGQPEAPQSAPAPVRTVMTLNEIAVELRRRAGRTNVVHEAER